MDDFGGKDADEVILGLKGFCQTNKDYRIKAGKETNVCTGKTNVPSFGRNEPSFERNEPSFERNEPSFEGSEPFLTNLNFRFSSLKWSK